MKIALILVFVMAVALAGCSTTKPAGNKTRAHAVTLPDAETVMVTYHVQAGCEAAFEARLQQAWRLYQKQRLVVPNPHIVLQSPDGTGKSRYVEIFTWVNHTVPDHAPVGVTEIWAKMSDLCEKRDGHGGIEGGEVHFVPDSK